MKRLLLDLKYYDEAGRVKPGSGLLWCVAFLCRSVLILVMTLAGQQQTNQVLLFFYPDNAHLYAALGLALPAALGYLLVAFREKITRGRLGPCLNAARLLLLCSSAADLAYHVYLAERQHWQFSLSIGVVLLLDLFIIYYLIKSQHLPLLISDWRRERHAERSRTQAVD